MRDVGPGRTALASVAPGLTAAVDAVISTSARSRLGRCSYLIELAHTNHIVQLFELLSLVQCFEVCVFLQVKWTGLL